VLEGIDIPSRRQLDRLMAIEGEPVVSLYFANEFRGDSQRARAALERAIGEATRAVRDASDPEAARVVEEELMETALDEDWPLGARTLALFATPYLSAEFRLANELPSRVYVSSHARVAPLLRSVSLPQSAFVLALAHGSARLLQLGPESPARELAVNDLPSDAASAAGRASLGDRSPKGRVQGSEGLKMRLRQYARKVDRAIAPVLAGSGAPLVLAAAEPIASIYRSVCSYPELCDVGIAGNPERLTDAEMEEAARVVVDDLNRMHVRALASLLAERRGAERTAEDPALAAVAAERGAVETLLFNLDVSLDDAPPAAGVAPSELESLIRSAWRTGAEVLALRPPEMPSDGAVAAILRYPLR
jgi:hypothetical protein